MSLSVHVLGREVATLEAVGDFKSSMTYHAAVAADDFVSLTMHVRTEPYIWDDVLHPVFQMNLPEGYLLQVLQEQFGPVIGASPMALLAVIGRNMIGRIQVAPPGAKLDEPAEPVDVAGLLQGDNSEEAFAELVRRHGRRRGPRGRGTGLRGGRMGVSATTTSLTRETRTTLSTTDVARDELRVYPFHRSRDT